MQKSVVVAVIINEQHKLTPQQIEAINQKWPNCSIRLENIPADGFNIEDQDKLANRLALDENIQVLFASPIPYLLLVLASISGQYCAEHDDFFTHGYVHVFHNNARLKKVLPNGKVIYTASQTGWEIK